MSETSSHPPSYDEQQLIALLEEKSPDELTIGEIEAMRAALPRSPELQQVLSRHIQMDHYLADALGRLSLSVDEIMARAAADSGSPRTIDASTLAFGVLFLLAGVIGFFAVGKFLSNSEPNAAAVANSSSDKEEKEELEKHKQKPALRREHKLVSQEEILTAAEEAQPRPVSESTRIAADQPEAKPIPPVVAGTEVPREEPRGTEASEASKMTVEELLARLEAPNGVVPAVQNVGEKKVLVEAEAADALEQGGPEALVSAPESRAVAEQDLDEILFPGRATLTDEQQLKKLRGWFAAVPGANYQFQVKKTEAVLQGVAQIKSPWRRNVMLRLELSKITGTRIHLWHGRRGVTIYAQQPASDKTWAASTTTRIADEALPTTYALTSTDHGRAWRTGDNGQPGPTHIDIRYEAGEVIVSRGDIKLLSAPLPGFPEEVYLEGRTQLCDVGQWPAVALHPELGPARTTEFDLHATSNVPWLTNLEPKAKLTKLESGGARLEVEASSEIQSAALSLPPGGVREIVFEVGEYSPGTGVFVGDALGNPLAQARLFQVKNSKQEQLVVGTPSLQDRTVEKSVDFSADLNGYVGERAFIKVIASGGRLRFWISSDGQHWAQLDRPQTVAAHDIRSVGLLCGPIKKSGEIRLLGLNVYHLSMFDQLAPPELVARVPAISASSVSAWIERVIESQPRDISSENWRAACLLRSLAAGTKVRLAGELSRRFLLEQLTRTPELAEKLKLMEAFTLLSDTWSQGEGSLNWSWIENRYQRFGMDQMIQGEPAAFQTLFAPLVCLPVWTADKDKLPLQELARRELLAWVATARWPDVGRCSRRLMTYGYLGTRQENKQLALTNDWALASAARHGAENLVDEGIAVLDARWRHPLSIELSKEGFNVLAELEVALANQAYQDACEIVSSTQGAGAFGLLPSGKDPSLWSSFPLAVSDKMRRFPEMQTTMREQFGSVGLLRVKQGMVQADQNALEMATVQFFGTPASSLAHFWLGDRSLAVGDFSRATRHFAQAESDAEPALKFQIRAHRRLAAALTGEDWGTPVMRAVRLGETQMPAEQFETLVTDTLHRVRGSNGQDLKTAPAASTPISSTGRTQTVADRFPSPKPTPFSIVRRGKLEQIAGSLPGAVRQAAQQEQLDGASRSFAPLVDQDLLYYTDGAQVTAWNLVSGAQVWRTKVAGPGGNTQQPGLFSPRPVLANGILVTRRRIQQSYGLVALEADSGKVLWQADGQQDKAFELAAVSDPVPRNGEILSLASEQFGREELVSLVAHDLETGALSRKQSVGIFSQAWQQYQACAVKLHHDSLYAVLGGSVLCLAPEGEVRWVRRQAWIAPDLALDWAAQAVSPPYIHQQAMYLSPVGTQGIECLEANTGKLLWRQPTINAWRILGVSKSVLVVRTATGLAGLKVKDGSLLWRHPIKNSLDCVCATGPGGVLYARTIGAREKNKFHPQLVWIDPATGQRTARDTLWELISEKPAFGPLFGNGRRTWALFGQRNQPLSRELLELQPKDHAESTVEKIRFSPQQAKGLKPWASVAPRIQEAAELVLPDWTLLSCEEDATAGLWPEYQARKNILALKPIKGETSRLARFVTIPKAGRTILQLDYAASPNGSCTLLVKLGESSLWRKKVSGKETAGAWQKSEIELTPFAGQSGWLQIQQSSRGQANEEAYWARAEVKTSP